MMKTQLLHVVLLIFFLSTACTFPEESRDAEAIRYESEQRIKELDEQAKAASNKEDAIKPMSQLDTLFHLEVKKKAPDFQRLDSLLSAGADINSIYQYTISKKKLGAKLPIIGDLMRKKTREFDLQETPLYKKVLQVIGARFDSETYQTIEYLLKNGADPYFRTSSNKRAKGSYTPNTLEVILYKCAFQYTAFDNRYSAMQYLKLFKKYDFDMQKLGLTYSEGNWELIQLLLKEGAAKKLRAASSIGKPMGGFDWDKIVENHLDELKTYEINFDQVETHTIIFFKNFEKLRLLLDLGMSPNTRDAYTDAPIVFDLVMKDHVEVLKMLVEEYDADLKVRYKNISLIEYADRYRAEACLNYLKNL